MLKLRLGLALHPARHEPFEQTVQVINSKIRSREFQT
jgi:hypothetical protein